MKQKFIKFTALMIAVLMAMSLFAGCVVKDSSKDNTTPKSESAKDNKAANEEKDKYQPIDGKVYEITYLTMTNAPVNEDSYIGRKFNEMFNVKLKPVFVESSKWDDLLNIRLSSGDIPDVFPSKSSDRFLRYQHGELIQELPIEVINKYAPDMLKAISRDDPKSWSVCTFEGKNYGIPYLVANYMIRDAIVWRDDWLRNVGIEKIPDTITEWEEALIKFRNDDPDKNGNKDTYGCSGTIIGPVFGAYGAMIDMWWNTFWLEKDGKIVNSAIEPGTKEALKLLSRWYGMDLIDPEFVAGENKGGYWAVSTDFVNSKIGVSTMGSAYHWQKEGNGLVGGANYNEMKKINPDATYEFGNPPLGPDGKSRGTTKLPLSTGASYVFSKNVEPDKLGRILQMFNWPMADYKNYIFNRYGEEGIHHIVTKEAGYDVYNIAEPYKSDPARATGEVGYAAFFWQADVNNTRKINGAYFDNFLKKGFDRYGIEDMGYKLYIPSGATFATDLHSLMQETYINIITGKKPIESFDEFVEKWKKNGGDQMLKEANDHYAKTKSN
ncbi:MAG TPA: hypothetical protein PK733_09825 [Clostridiales bacterium]|nr:hypothetical protein [Clostridiales bacterium]